MAKEFNYSLRGRVFGELTVLEPSHKNTGGNYWKCICSCGGVRFVRENRMGMYKTCTDKIHHLRDKLTNVATRYEQYLDDNLVINTIEFEGNYHNRFNLECRVCGFKFSVSDGSTRKIRCQFCNKDQPLMEQNFRQAAEIRGFKLLEIIKRKNNKYLRVECRIGHELDIDASKIKTAICRVCFPSKGAKKTDEELKTFAISKGNYDLINSYVDDKGRRCVNVVCENGHNWSPILSNFTRPERNCPYCTNSPPSHMFLYLQEVHQEAGNKYLKYGITRNNPYLRASRQEKSSGMIHDIFCHSYMDYDTVIRAEDWLRKNIPSAKFNEVFDGYTETVGNYYETFLKYYVSNAHMLKTLDVVDFVNKVNTWVMEIGDDKTFNWS